MHSQPQGPAQQGTSWHHNSAMQCMTAACDLQQYPAYLQEAHAGLRPDGLRIGLHNGSRIPDAITKWGKGCSLHTAFENKQ
jgi:hypothetical protein